MTNPQCIYIPDGSVVISGETFDYFSSWERLQKEYLEHIEQLHAAVKTAQELAATRLQEKERIVAIGEIARRELAQEIERLTAKLDYRNREPPHCPTCDCGPASLVGALQDVVHTDPGPVRAGRSVRQVEPSDDPISYSVSDAIRIAGLWRAGKMIGGDEDGVRDALLAEIERLNSLNRASERWDCKCDNTDCPYCGPRLAESRSG